MPDPFAINTPDPRFNPRLPVTVNGHAYVPLVVVREIVGEARWTYQIRDALDALEADCG